MVQLRRKTKFLFKTFFILVIIYLQRCLIIDNTPLIRKNGATYRIMRRCREPLKDSTESSKIEPSNASALKNLEVDYGAVCM